MKTLSEMKTLSVIPEGHAMVPDYDALEQGKLRFIGRIHMPDAGVNGGWVPVEVPTKVRYRAEYIQELRAGCLLPGDHETARLARIPFIPFQS